MRITREWLETLSPKKAREYSDDELSGLRLKVSPTARSWSVLVTLVAGVKRLTMDIALTISPRQANVRGRKLAALPSDRHAGRRQGDSPGARGKTESIVDRALGPGA